MFDYWNYNEMKKEKHQIVLTPKNQKMNKRSKREVCHTVYHEHIKEWMKLLMDLL